MVLMCCLSGALHEMFQQLPGSIFGGFSLLSPAEMQAGRELWRVPLFIVFSEMALSCVAAGFAMCNGRLAK